MPKYMVYVIEGWSVEADSPEHADEIYRDYGDLEFFDIEDICEIDERFINQDGSVDNG